MNDRDRIQRLQGLVAQLERLPASAERDGTLSKLRRRAVDIETGETPATLRRVARRTVELPRRAAVGGPERLARPAVRRVRAPAPSPLPPVVARTRAEGAVDLLEHGGLLSLDDAPVAPGAPSRPWSSGLRG